MELVELLDNKRRSLDKKIERYEKKAKGEYSQIVHSWIRNNNGEFLLEKRSMTKKYFPGKWTVAGGGVDVGENTFESAIRETKEEVGVELDIDDVELVLSLKRKDVFLDIYMTKKDVDIENVTMQETEVTQVKWASIEEIKEMIKNDEVTDSITMYFDFFCKLIESCKQ